MTISLISTPPTPPNRLSDTPANFADKADAWTSWWTTASAELNTSIGQANTDIATVNTQSAQVAADAIEVADNTEAVQDIWAAIVAELTGGGSGSSGDSVAIGLGSKSFPNASTGRLWYVGMSIIARSSASASNYMAGEITAYNPSTGALTITSTNTGGSGSHADWVIYPAGQKYNTPWTEVVELATTSGTAVTFSDVDDLPYTDLMLEFLGVSHGNGGTQDIRIELSDDGTNWTTATAIYTAAAASETFYGTLTIAGFRRAAGGIRTSLGDLTANRTTSGAGGVSRTWRIAAGVAHIRVSVPTGPYDAGSIKLLGR